MVEPARLRDYANLPSEVPDTLLSGHLEAAERDLHRRAGLQAAPDGYEPVWDEAVTVKALASCLPWLNTFALDGAAKVGRLEGTVEFRFLTPDDVEAREKRLLARFEQLLAVLPKSSAAEDAEPTGVTATAYSLDAI
jgi:hypothetical protein